MPLLATPAGFSALGCGFPLPLYAGLFVESTATGFTDDTFLLYPLGKAPYHAFETFAFVPPYFSHMKSPLFVMNSRKCIAGNKRLTKSNFIPICLILSSHI